MIAPHQGKEIELVTTGFKPLGSISATYALSNALKELHTRVIGDSVYFALNEQPLDTYEFLMSPSAQLFLKSKQEHQRLLGRLFGYTEDEIDTFIEANLECACGNCTGGF